MHYSVAMGGARRGQQLPPISPDLTHINHANPVREKLSKLVEGIEAGALAYDEYL